MVFRHPQMNQLCYTRYLMKDGSAFDKTTNSAVVKKKLLRSLGSAALVILWRWLLLFFCFDFFRNTFWIYLISHSTDHFVLAASWLVAAITTISVTSVCTWSDRIIVVMSPSDAPWGWYEQGVANLKLLLYICSQYVRVVSMCMCA